MSHHGNGSRVALLQAGGVLGWVALAALAVAHWREADATWLSVLALAPLLMPGWVIALELLCAAQLAGCQDRGLKLRGWHWLRTWWAEWRLNLTVFAWRQPFAWRQLPDSSGAHRDQSPIVFVHGYLCNRGFWLPWLRVCRGLGRPYVTVNLEPLFASIDDYVPAIEAAVRRAEALTGRPPVLVGHSMGGLAIRAWIASQSATHPRRWLAAVTLGSPHAGTWLARWSRTENGLQMRQGSDWLVQLREREQALGGAAPHEAFLCWSSATDNAVFPADTATLPGADNRRVAAAGHIELAYLPRVISTSLDWIASAERSPAARTAS